MFSNLISTGWLRAQQSCLAQLRREAAALLGIPESWIERIECWQHQLWVVISGVGARLISYRRLPSWILQVIAAIGRVCNFEQLKEDWN